MRKKDVVTKQDIEKYYNKVRKIRFDNDIVINNFSYLYYYFLLKKSPTYYVRGKIQCESKKNRSLDDFIIIYKYYFPDKTVKDFFKEYYDFIEDNLNPDGEPIYCYLSWCGNIRKYNFQSSSYWTNIQKLDFIDQGFVNCKVNFKDYKN